MMIDYKPFWDTLEESSENWYTLTHNYDINPSVLHRLKHNKPISTTTIDMFCNILHCDVSAIVRHLPDSSISDES